MLGAMRNTLITPASLWLAHRTAAGGKSTVTGAPLPETIEDCFPGPQETHYAMACYIAAVHEDPGVVPIPSKVTTDRAAELKVAAECSARITKGMTAAFAPIMGDPSA